MDNNCFLSSTEFDFKDKKVLLRIDTDVDLKEEKGNLIVDEDFRLRSVLPTINLLQKKKVKQIILIGHLGRPNGKGNHQLSLKPVADWFKKELNSCSLEELEKGVCSDKKILLENIRFYREEEENNQEFAKKLADLGDVFVNDAFAVSHRNHASITSLPKLLPSFLGLRFEAEIETLSWIKKETKKPLVFVLGGSKKGKLDYIEFLTDWTDYLLVGGKLPLKIDFEKEGLIKAELKENKRDITEKSIEKFKSIINKAGTIIWAGPMGVYEEEKNRKGTIEIAQAIARTNVFKVAGGGDTHRVLSWTNLWDKFDFVSVGGGAMLQFLRDGTLPGIKAMIK